MKKSALFLSLFLIITFSVFISVPLYAQSTYLEDNSSSLWEEESFLDDLGFDERADDKAEVVPELEAGTGDYVTEEEAVKQLVSGTEGSGRDIAAAIDESKLLLHKNILIGAGTGAMLGGWLALTNPSDARTNTRLLGSGAVLGAMLGFFIGTKAVYLPPPGSPPEPTPATQGALEPYHRQNSGAPASSPPLLAMNYSWRF